MLPKRVKSMVVPHNKWVQEVVETDMDRGPPAKRTHSSEADPEIIMTITQPVNSNKANKDGPKSKNTPAHSRAQESGNSQNSALIVHQNSRCNMPAMLLLFQGNISSSCISPLHPGGLWAHPHLPAFGTGTCGHQELFISFH